MRRDPLVSVFVALVSVTVCVVVAWLIFFRDSSRTVVRSRTGPALVLVQPPSTPLRDSIREPKKNRRPQGSAGKGSPTPGSAHRLKPLAKSPTRAGPKASTGLPKRRKRRTASHPHQTTPAPQSPPSAPEKPLVTVTVPAPASACLKGVGGVNC